MGGKFCYHFWTLCAFVLPPLHLRLFPLLWPRLACSIRARRCFRISDKKNIVSDKCHKLSFYFLHI